MCFVYVFMIRSVDRFNSISICSLNVRGITDSKKRKDVLMWLRKKHHSIYCLQDIHCGPNIEVAFKDEWGADVYFACKSTNSRGVAILFDNNLEYSIVNRIADVDGNYLGLKLNVDNVEFGLITIYGPNRDDPNFYQYTLSNLMDELDAESYIICGDFNLVQNQALDTFGYKHENNKLATLELNKLKNLYSLIDPWRLDFPNKAEFTWKNPSCTKMSRLDFFLVSGLFSSLVTEPDISFGYKTDHSLISIKLNILKLKQGKGFWKFNTSLLKNDLYVLQVRRTIQETAEEYGKSSSDNVMAPSVNIDDTLFWETLKMKIRSMTISFSADLKRKLNKKELYLEKSINILEKGLHLARIEVKELYEKYKTQLENIREYHLEGVIIRSKAKWLEFGEKPTKYFCSLEKSHFINKSISKLTLENGEIVVNQNDILNLQRSFYKSLYQSRLIENDTRYMKKFVDKYCIRKLDVEMKQTMDKDFTEQDVLESINSMNNNKTPGTDGLPVEFYKFFWPDIKIYLIRSFEKSFITGDLSINQKRGIITCIPKGNKDRTLLKNWRPISLLNTDYKIISNVFAHRLKQCLPSIIHQDQKGFIKGRFIGENTRLVYDIMEYLQNSNESGLLFLIDFEKAFDSVEWKFLETTLESFNFGNYFIKWFKILYYNGQSCVINNGVYSEFFRLQRGCRQGDPISPYLFLLASEILANSIRVNKGITGITIKGMEFRIGQYADDTFLFLDGKHQSLKSAIACLERFEMFSGLKINTDKCETIWLGTKRGSLDQIMPNIKVVDQFKLLGIIFPPNLCNFCKVNIDPKITEIEKLLLAYKRRKLSLIGRVTVIKCMAISKIIHLISIIDHFPLNVLQKIEKIFQTFIWDGKTSRIQYEFGTNTLEDGGLALPNLKTLSVALKCTWIQKSFNLEGSWQKLFCLMIDNPDIVWNLDPKSLKIFASSIKNSFWRNVMCDWSYFLDTCITVNYKIIKHYSIWNSFYIRHPNIIHLKNKLIQNGCHNIGHLYYNGQFLSLHQFQERYNITLNFLDFESLKKSVPLNWQQKIQVNFGQTPENFATPIEHMIKHSKVCKYIYHCIVLHKTRRRTVHENKWENILDTTFSEAWWKNTYLRIHRVSMDTKLNSFQFKIIHRLLITNKQLKLWKLKDTETCTFCETQVETIEHLLSDCNVSKNLWTELANWLLPEINIYPFIILQNIIMCDLEGPHSELISAIFLLTKRYIYVQRCLKAQLNITSLK